MQHSIPNPPRPPSRLILPPALKIPSPQPSSGQPPQPGQLASWLRGAHRQLG
ncbi:hypothetical protein EJ06DRAFT_533292 [Trichodelitschia bisporula]|uniref:Uncharacterized protein n=1 Tax=Trichodelitschia bisporula TaxID=703511 RepID=A0A6G1HMM6_9PEZI|nr:hypothetical protein EJ06DRAFT_533292 [Trichodelitschia bisporula]